MRGAGQGEEFTTDSQVLAALQREPTGVTAHVDRAGRADHADGASRVTGRRRPKDVDRIVTWLQSLPVESGGVLLERYAGYAMGYGVGYGVPMDGLGGGRRGGRGGAKRGVRRGGQGSTSLHDTFVCLLAQGIAERLTVVTFPPGTLLFDQGEISDHLLILTDGTV